MERITVIGAGLMGHTIALQAALSGFKTVIYDVSIAELDRCMLDIQTKCALMQKEGLLDETAVLNTIRRVSSEPSLTYAIQDATFIIECVPEVLDLKLNMMSKLDQLCTPEVILASTTSTFSPDIYLDKLHNSERSIIAHFWNPAHLVPVVEVLRAKQTSQQVFERTLQLLQDMNKRAVVLNKALPGFIGNRLQAALFREAEYILSQNVCSIEDIDAVVTNGFGRRLSITGPFLSADFTGLDVMLSVCRQLYHDLSNADTPSTGLASLVEKGKLGKKTGSGFYKGNVQLYDQAQVARETELMRQLGTKQHVL